MADRALVPDAYDGEDVAVITLDMGVFNFGLIYVLLGGIYFLKFVGNFGYFLLSFANLMMHFLNFFLVLGIFIAFFLLMDKFGLFFGEFLGQFCLLIYFLGH